MQYGRAIIHQLGLVIQRVVNGQSFAIGVKVFWEQVFRTDHIRIVIGNIIPQVSTAEQRAVTTEIIPPMSTALIPRLPSTRDIAALSISIILTARLVLL